MNMLKSLKLRGTVKVLCVLAVALTARDIVVAQDASGMVRYNAVPVGNKAKIEGTSTVHDWTMDSTVVGGFIEADAKFPESALTDPKAAQPKVEVFMPVRQFKSYLAAMDDKMQETMNEPKFKRIEFKLIELKPKSAAGATGPLQFDATGAITVSGVTKTNSFPVTIEKKDDKITVKGGTGLKMTDFGLKPPSPALLPIKTGDEVKVSFEWTAAKKKE
jgi:polyisoprenoid-binding protein YceI